MSVLDYNIEKLCDYIREKQFSFDLDDQLTFIEKIIPKVFEIFAQKNKRQYYPDAQEYLERLIDNVNPWYSPNISSILSDIIKTSMKAEKEYALRIFEYLISKNQSQIKISMPELVPFVSSFINDISQNIKTVSTSVLEKLLKCSGNVDLDAFIPAVLEGIKNHSAIYDSVEALASCVFVQNVEAPALAITMPIIMRGLTDKKTATRRLTCVIIDNMCKLIEHPKEVLPFYENLLSSLERCNDTMSDPEARKVSTRALNTLKESCAENENAVFHKLPDDFVNMIREECGNKSLSTNDTILHNLGTLSANICNSHCFDF